MRPGKKAIFDEVRGNLDSAGFTILADYRGMSVEQMSDLRRRLCKLDGRLQVVKNSMFSKVAEDLGWTVHDNCLHDPTVMVTGAEDVVLVAKLLKDFVKETGLPLIKGGVLAKRAISGDEVNAMADMPSRDSMLAMFVGTVAAPMTQMVGVLNQKVLTLLYVLKEAADKKSGEE